MSDRQRAMIGQVVRFGLVGIRVGRLGLVRRWLGLFIVLLGGAAVCMEAAALILQNYKVLIDRLVWMILSFRATGVANG